MTGAGGQWGIVVGGLGKGPGSVSIHSPFTVQSANSKEDELEADLVVMGIQHSQRVGRVFGDIVRRIAESSEVPLIMIGARARPRR